MGSHDPRHALPLPITPASAPLVSILTPVYNGEMYLAECIESVLAQTYPHWEYILVNNRSTDRTLEIAESYAKRDPRIIIHTNDSFVGMIENHNIAFRLASPESKYCKIVSADDWIYPECVARLVELAERNPNVSIVGSYAMSDTGINSMGLPRNISVFIGRYICRLYLKGLVDSFATPSQVLYRASAVRSRVPFFPGPAPYADLAVCLDLLRSSDFGFVHQILSYQRLHPESVTSHLQTLNSFLLDRIELLAEYGRYFLTEQELQSRQAELLPQYYTSLARAVLHCRRKTFWRFHRKRLNRLGLSVCGWRLAWALAGALADVILNPKQSAEKMVALLRARRWRLRAGARPAHPPATSSMGSLPDWVQRVLSEIKAAEEVLARGKGPWRFLGRRRSTLR